MVKHSGIDPRQRLLELATAQRVSLAALSEMIGRNSSYLQQFIRKGSPRKLEEGDRRKIAQFFGIPESDLGAVEEKSSPPPMVKARQDWIEIPRLSLGASAGPGRVALISQNLAYPAFEVALDELDIVGRVVWKSGRL